ncbi:hypothetical protein ACFYMW_34720 [Streptomyces sp. NPDC006692]|uniref:hypothetical protein n=1 Tax=Streptomyces sp. NPDC006692 TaxID=3364758 RepID=UPI0036B48A80
MPSHPQSRDVPRLTAGDIDDATSFPSVRGPLQVIGGMLVFAGTALPAWISAVRRR